MTDAMFMFNKMLSNPLRISFYNKTDLQIYKVRSKNHTTHRTYIP